MSNHNDMPLTMNSDTFAAFRTDFDKLLARTIGNMEMKGTVEATITCKFGISLEKQQTRDFRSNGYDGCRDIINPTIKHDITSVMQVKDKVSGKFHGDYEMVFDRDTHRYLIRKVQDGQLDMFDDDGNETGALGLPAPDDYVDADEAREDDGEENNAADAAPMTPFKWLCGFIGEALVVSESNGIYTVRTTSNRVLISSAASEDSPLYCDAEKMKGHLNCINVVCVGYGEDENGEPANVSIECEDCNEVIFDMDATSNNAASVAADEETGDDGSYEYEEPESTEE